VLSLHVSHQLVQLLRIVSVWNSVTVENSQVNVSNVSISCSIVPPTSLGLPIQRLACGLCKVSLLLLVAHFFSLPKVSLLLLVAYFFSYV